MKFSTITYFVIAFIMTFASTFGMADAAVPVKNLRSLVEAEEMVDSNELRELEIAGLEAYHKDVDAHGGRRELSPPLQCYLRLCFGFTPGTCHRVYKKCYPL